MPQSERKLAAIMFTDLVGYTSLGQRNESLSLALVEEQRNLIRPIIRQHHGREVKTMGDSFLIEFLSALDAVRCAYDIQRAAREFNIPLPEERRVHLRVGVHLGDVVESKGDISGDAVNVASRIESLAEDGGVCLTRQVYDQVHNKFEIPLSRIGSRFLKNVNSPVEVYRMQMPWRGEVVVPSIGLDRKRVAVLPFANMSPDPNDSYFADGITEEIISTVSGVSGLSVISRTSVMGYKGTSKKVGEIGQELEVGSVLEGSLRKAGNKIRISTQLIDVNQDSHVWVQSYDRDFDDIFAVQTDIAKNVADALKVRILPGEMQRIERTPTRSTEAFALYLKGRYYWNDRTEESMKTSIRYFEKALERDQNYALAYVGIADCYTILVGHGYMRQSEGYPKAKDCLVKALEIDEELGEAHATLGTVLHSEWDWIQSEREFKRALELSPSYATAHHWFSMLLASRGRIKESISEIEKALKLDPNSMIILSAMGIWVYYDGDYDRAIEIQKKVLETDPNFLPAFWNIFDPYIEKKMINEASAIIQRYLELAGKPRSIFGPLAQLYAAVGKEKEARRALEEAERLGSGEYTSPLNIGMAHHYLGEDDLAFEWFSKAVEVKDPRLLWLKVDPKYNSMRHDPRFGALLKRIGLE